MDGREEGEEEEYCLWKLHLRGCGKDRMSLLCKSLLDAMYVVVFGYCAAECCV